MEPCKRVCRGVDPGMCNCKRVQLRNVADLVVGSETLLRNSSESLTNITWKDTSSSLLNAKRKSCLPVLCVKEVFKIHLKV